MAKVPYAKPALSYADQLNQLKIRGLFVENDAKALHLLENISYYRLSGYWHPMLADPKMAHVFKPGSTFDNAFKLYCFDRELRKMITGELEKIEIAVRAKMIHILSDRHGAFWYTDSRLFTNHAIHTATLAKISKEYARTDEKFITGFKRKYSDPLPPSWMMLEVTSFGSLSMLYQNLIHSRDKRDIAHYFGLDSATFQSWLHSIVYIRNVCAHHSRLWNRIMRITPALPHSPTNPWIKITSLSSGVTGALPININNRTYYFLSMIIYFLNTINPNHSFKNRLYNLLKKYPMVDVQAMGFPVGWQQESLWNWQTVVKENKWHRLLLQWLKF